jgi:hypothetical protein
MSYSNLLLTTFSLKSLFISKIYLKFSYFKIYLLLATSLATLCAISPYTWHNYVQYVMTSSVPSPRQWQENYCHCFNDNVLYWSQKLVSDSRSVTTVTSSLQVDSDRKQALIIIIWLSRKPRFLVVHTYMAATSCSSRDKIKRGGSPVYVRS